MSKQEQKPKEDKITKAHKELKWKESLRDLEEKYSLLELKPSGIEGIGVFATKDIKKGDRLYADELPHAFDLPCKYVKKLSKGLKDKILGHFPYKAVKDNVPFIYPVVPMVIYMNHSTKPNYDPQKDKALKDIKAGEEVTEDYGKLDGAKEVFDFIN